MRRIVLLLALSLLLALPVQGAFSEEYYRAIDTTDQLSKGDISTLDENCVQFAQTYRLDLALLCVQAQDYQGGTVEELANAYYEGCLYGYGENKSGFHWVYDATENQIHLFAHGDAQDRISEEQIQYAAQKSLEKSAEDGVYGALSGGVLYLTDFLEAVPAGGVQRVEETSNLPSWYPADPKSFTFYHDETAPRVVDKANILTDYEEQELEQRIAELQKELGYDFVIYTDTTDYGLTHAVCAADFYDFNGYGFGANREGVCLFIDMDPQDRGWWCCCTGPVTMGLYTEDIANQIDDALYPYMADGQYGAGVKDWLENFRSLYAKGIPFAPDWYPDLNDKSFQRFNNADAPRVVDELGYLTQEERQSLEDKAREISQKYGLDVVIHLAKPVVSWLRQEFAQRFYYYNGYGYGDSFDGILLSVCKRDGYYPTVRIHAEGTGQDKLTQVNLDRLLKQCESLVEDDRYFKGLDKWLSNVEHMERTGRVMPTSGYWIFLTVIGLILSGIVSAVMYFHARGKMAPPKEKEDADIYLVDAQSRIDNAGSYFLYSTSHSRYDPPQRSSSSSGRSGRSSYSSSYHGSSGSSHSGSGRRF